MTRALCSAQCSILSEKKCGVMREERKDESEAGGSLISTGREATDAVNLAPVQQ